MFVGRVRHIDDVMFAEFLEMFDDGLRKAFAGAIATYSDFHGVVPLAEMS
ncbi:hypothetical protein NCH01_00600 [Neoasaia chiangmaiensis]|nr:hypothetical protein NCH01_00600 [Neoasaia chiangmaiensis]